MWLKSLELYVDMKKILSVILFLLTACSAPTTSEKIILNGVELDFLVRGEGPPLYMLHGGMESRDNFTNQIPVFAKYFTVVALDSREQGRSGSSDTQITYEKMSKDIIALATHLGHENISIMGLSDGGITAIVTAINKPDLVEKLILLGATFHYDSYPDDVREFIANYEWDGVTDPDQYPGNFIKHYLTGHEDLSGFGEKLKEMSLMWTTSPTFIDADLHAISAKTLVINGDHEDSALHHVLQLYDAIPDAELFIVPDATHYALHEKPELLNAVMMDFLRDAN